MTFSTRACLSGVVAFALLLSGCMMKAPVAAPTPPQVPPSLAARFAELNCSIVQIMYTGGDGTGFFISPDGDILTAAHVALNSIFDDSHDPSQPGAFTITTDYKPGLSIRRNGQSAVQPQLPRLSQDDVLNATSDLAVLRTGIKTSCYLKIGQSSNAAIGDHVISIGYPDSAPTGALYEGF